MVALGRVELTEDTIDGEADGSHHPPQWRREHLERWMRRRRRAEVSGRACQGPRDARLTTLNEFVGRWGGRAIDQPIQFTGLGIEQIVGVTDAAASREPPAELEHHQAQDSNGRDVTVNAPLVTQPIHKPGFTQHLVEGRAVLGRCCLTQLGGERLGPSQRRARLDLERGTHATDDARGTLADRRVHHVEPVQQPVAGC